MSQQLRRVAIVGSARIPFCRSNTLYADLTNLDMLTACLNGLAEAYGLKGAHIDEVTGGAVVTHSRDWNLAREAVLGSALAPSTPGITMMQACGTSLQAAIGIGAKIACGLIDCGIAMGSDTTSDPPLVVSRKLAQRLNKAQLQKTTLGRLKEFQGFSAKELLPLPPAASEPRTGLGMGQHCELMAQQWGITREAQDELALTSHQRAADAYRSGFLDDLIVPCAGVYRDNNVRADLELGKLQSLKTAFEKGVKGTLTAGNSTPLTDGAAAVLLASEEWARARGLPVLAYLGASETAALDFVAGEGLLMAPTIAVARLLRRCGCTLQDFDRYEIHEAFAAQVLATLAAFEDREYCRRRLDSEVALGGIDRSRLNVKGSSIAYGHPFAATGARILGLASKLVAREGARRVLISICTAGGMGVAAVVEAGDA